MGMENNSGPNGPLQDNDRSNSSQAYLRRACAAADAGDHLLSIHLFLAAFETSLAETVYPSPQALEGIERAWGLAIATRQRTLAEYIFEKAEPFWDADQIESKAEELQRLAFDKLEEYGVPRDAIEEMASMVGDELMLDLPGIDVRFDEPGAVDEEGSPLADLLDAFSGMATERALDREDGASEAQRDRHEEAASRAQQLTDMAQALLEDMVGKAVNGALGDAVSASAAEAADVADGVDADAGAAGAAAAADEHASADDAAADEGASTSRSLTRSPLEQAMPDLAQALSKLGIDQVPVPQGAAVAAQAAPAGYAQLVGFDRAVKRMGELGVGRDGDPEFEDFVRFLNQRHGVSRPPRLGTVLFTGPGRDDLRNFMVATVGELGTPALRMRMDRNALGQSVLVVMSSPDFKTRINSVMRNGFDVPAVLILEDLDTWELPDFDSMMDESNPFLAAQMSRGARDALTLVAMALDAPEVDVFISATHPESIDPFFMEGIGVYERVEIGAPDAEERRRVWRAAQEFHPSMRGLDMDLLVACSRGLARSEIDLVASEAVEEAYRRSLEANRFTAVHTEDVLVRLSTFQELDSREYLDMERYVLQRFRQSLDGMDSWDELL